MKIEKEVKLILEKWISKLSRGEAEYFLKQVTKKDLNLFCIQARMKGLGHCERIELELILLKYLQLLMVMCSVSDDLRDIEVAQKFWTVPFKCEVITKGIVNKSYTDSIDDIYKQLETKYPIKEFIDNAVIYTNTLLKEFGTDEEKIITNILGHYSTPIIGFALVIGLNKFEFDFLNELKNLINEIMDRHFTNKRPHTPEIERYFRAMKFVSSYRYEK
jgi:hypothetical protein